MSSRITRALSYVIEELLKPSKQSEDVYPTKSLIENAYINGAGIELTWDNLWTYCLANARGVMSYMYMYLTDALMIDSSTFYIVPHSDNVKHMFLCLVDRIRADSSATSIACTEGRA